MPHHQSSQSTVSRRSLLKHGAGISALGITGLSASTGTVAARQCDTVVPKDYASIQAAVDNAAAGETICIQPGTYDEDVSIDKSVTLRGRADPRSNASADVDGQIEITTDGGGSAIRRLRISPSETFEGGTFPDPAGVLVKASEVVIENNIIEDITADLSNGAGSFTLHGVQVFGAEGADVSGVTVRDNVIRGFESSGVPGDWPKFGGIAAVKAQAGVSEITVVDNEITDHHSAGWVWGVVLTGSGSAPGMPENVTVEKNHVSGLNDGSVYDVFDGGNDGRNTAPYPGSAIGINGGAKADAATVTQNSLLAPNGAESKDDATTLVTECNWWGDRSGPTHDDNPDGAGTWALERGSATIDYTPWLNAPAPSNACIGGKSHGNGKPN